MRTDEHHCAGDAPDEQPGGWSRRRLLTATAVGAAATTGLVTATAAPATAARATYAKVGSANLYYEGSGKPTSFSFDTTFHSLCNTWLTNIWIASTPTSWDDPGQLWSYGVYVNKPGMHGSGRAIDITRIYCGVNGTNTLIFNARYDQWKNWGETSAKITTRKRYWAGVASLNRQFTYVLHYLYNTDHHNHVHADNQVSGSGVGSFGTGRRSQVLSTQAILRYIWGYSTGIDGIWGPQTDSHSRSVLSKAGISGGLTTSASNWRSFNNLAARWGNGRQTSW